jgi:hypothetical protein
MRPPLGAWTSGGTSRRTPKKCASIAPIPRTAFLGCATIALRATEWDENRHRPDTIRPQDVTPPHKMHSNTSRFCRFCS